MISFNTDDVKVSVKNKTRIKKWIVSVASAKKRTVGEVSFVFCSDKLLLSINKKFLNHNTLTDIITFDYSKETPVAPISGEIFISVERVKENAKNFSKTFEEELHRVIIHGVLHLLGYKDKTKVAKAEMTTEEDACLKQFYKAK